MSRQHKTEQNGGNVQIKSQMHHKCNIAETYLFGEILATVSNTFVKINDILL